MSPTRSRSTASASPCRCSTGLQVHNARTGGVLGLVTDAPQARRLYRVGRVIYATAPQRIYVVDADTTRLLKTLEIGASVGDVAVGASGRRALASLPSAHAVAVLATEYTPRSTASSSATTPSAPWASTNRQARAHDDRAGPAPRARAAAGRRRLRLRPEPPRLRAGPGARVDGRQPRQRADDADGANSYVVLRAEDAIVPLEWQPSGAVRQEARIATCHEPEQNRARSPRSARRRALQ